MALKKLKNFFQANGVKDIENTKVENFEIERNNQNLNTGEDFMSQETLKEASQKAKVEVEFTPNPNALKFIFPSAVIKEGKVTLTTKYEVPHVPLLSTLFDVEGVVQIHLFENVITISKDDSRNWEEVEPEIKEVFFHLMDSHNPAFEITSSNSAVSYEDLPPELQEINAILDRTIRPGLQSDGGDLEILELKENNELVIRYEGACGSCPSSTSGTLYAIEGILRDEFHPDIKVVTG